MKPSFTKINNSFFIILKYFIKTKIIIFFKFGALNYIEVSNIFDLFNKNLFYNEKYRKKYKISYCPDPSYITLCDIKIYHKKSKDNRNKISLYTILKQVPKDLLFKVDAIKIIIPADFFSRVTYKEVYSQGYDVSIVRLYTKND